MKKLLYLTILLLGSLLAQAQAQAPQAINYQTIVRDANGNVVANQPVKLGFLIHDSAIGGTVVYWETDSGTTNKFGLFTAAIGRGVVLGGTFNAINWSTGLKYLETEYFTGSPGSFLPMGTTELLSVPFALYAANGGGGGATGATGPAGAAGATGARGATGSQGATGTTGATGVAGANGAAGATGPTGANGSNGAAGANGATGATGANGTNGATGANGINGNDGATGPTGATGANGATGPSGGDGFNGADGATGPTGATGAAGNDGATGATGATGANGTNGNDGATGPAGTNGTNGNDGATGPTGAAGSNGTNGTDGATGPTGANGTNGNDGVTGPTGAQGVTGPTGPAGSPAEYADFYALMPADNAATVPLFAPIEFPQAGPASGSITSLGASVFNISNPGVYQVHFDVSVTEPGQLGIQINGILQPNTVVGRATGTSQITGTFIIVTSSPNSSISVINAGGFSALTITPLAGGINPVSAHLVITQIPNGGAAGANGATGATGANGTNGADGATGPTGATGANGTNGTDGVTGPTGAAGTNGSNGTDGVTGPTGATGSNGTNGNDGVTGATGAAGTNGTNGADGATGATGANGTNGTDGATGPTGATGATGTNGNDGVTGATGANGTNGSDGATGPAGANGTNGNDGATGATGANGTNGTDGATGNTGATGATGPGNANGTVNYVAKFSSSDSLISSSTIFDSAGSVGIGTNAPNSTLHVAGSVTLAYAIANTPTYTLGMSDHTVRRYGLCNNIIFPDASTCPGRIYVIISSNGSVTNVGLSPVPGQIVYDDVTNTTYGFLTPNQRIQVQSDGTNWIVIGN